MNRSIGVLTVLLVAVTSQAVQAQDWPSRPVRIIVPFAPGGTADAMSRPVAEQLRQQLGQQFVLENRGGAGGLIGSAAVANAAADGYTIGVTSIATLVIAPMTSPNPGYDPIKSFRQIALAGGPPTVIVVHPSLGPKTFGEFRDLLKKQKDPLPYVSPGIGTIGNLIPEFWAEIEKVRISHIAYKGGGQAINDLIGGHIKMGSVSWPAALGAMRAGTVIPLAVTSSRRMPEFPDVPTMKELGYPDLAVTTWQGFAAPAGVPSPIVEKLNREIGAALDTSFVRTQLDRQGIEIQKMTPDELTAFVEAQLAKWGPFAKKLLSSN